MKESSVKIVLSLFCSPNFLNYVRGEIKAPSPKTIWKRNITFLKQFQRKVRLEL